MTPEELAALDSGGIRLVPLGSGPDPDEEKWRRDYEYLKEHPGAVWAVMGGANVSRILLLRDVAALLNVSVKESKRRRNGSG